MAALNFRVMEYLLIKVTPPEFCCPGNMASEYGFQYWKFTETKGFSAEMQLLVEEYKVELIIKCTFIRDVNKWMVGVK